MDIEISLKPAAKKPKTVKSKYVQELYIIGQVAFMQTYRRAMNNSLLRARLLSLVPVHILRSADSFRFCQSGTLKSIIQSFLAWIRNLGHFKNMETLSDQSIMRNLLLLSVFGQLINANLLIYFKFPIRLPKDAGCLLSVKIIVESQDLFVDCVKSELLSDVVNLSVPFVCIEMALGAKISLIFDHASATKQIFSLLSSLCSIHNISVTNFRPQSESVEMDIPSKASQIKNHPIYILESHLKKYEALHPPEIAGFMDSETVYFRKNVQKLRSKEAWLTQHGMSVKNGEQPAKVVQLSSITKKLQDLYGEWQVEPYTPPTALDGKIPRNNFGNVDLFTANMIPKGCYHETKVNAAKIAKSLGLEYAEACTGFSFHGGRAAPDISGIVLLEKDVELFESEYQSRATKIHEAEARKYDEEMVRFWDILAYSIVSGRRLKKTSGAVVIQSDSKSEVSGQSSNSIFVKRSGEEFSSFDQL